MHLALITDQLNKKDKAFLNRYKLDFHDSEVPSSFSTRSLNKFFLILQKLKVSNLTKQISNFPFFRCSRFPRSPRWPNSRIWGTITGSPPTDSSRKSGFREWTSLTSGLRPSAPDWNSTMSSLSRTIRDREMISANNWNCYLLNRTILKTKIVPKWPSTLILCKIKVFRVF